MLDTGSPLTSMSRRLYERLLASGLLTRVRANRYELRSVQIGGHDIGALQIRGSDFLSRVGADGVLGLDFFARFTSIHFHMPTGLLTLEL